MKVLLILAALAGLTLAAPTQQVKALPDDFDELLALVPWTDLAVLVFDHIDTDPEFNQVLTYLQSPEWDAIVQYVRDHPTYQVLKAFCLEKGVDLEAVAQAIHDFIHSLTPGPDTGDATLREFLDGVLAVMPWDDISAWLDDKMTNSADFIELYGVASSDDMYAMVEEVRALPEVQRIAAILEGFGVRLDEVLALVYEFFGWPAPGLKVKALPDDFDELLALVPWTDLAVLVFDHIDTDPEFNQVLTYLQSPEWDAIVQYVRDHPTYQVLKAFCLEKGVDLEAVAQAIHDFIHSLTPGPDTGDATLREFLDGVLAVMPWDDISAWLDDKMTNSADFIELYGVASSDDMYAMVEEVRALPEVQRIAAILEGFGVRLDEVLALVYEFFGWPAPGLKVTALPDDFDELLALVPWTDLAVLVFDHIDTDPEFNQVLTYLQSPEWDAIVQYVRDHPTYQVLKAFCLEKGVDLEAVAQAIHDFIHSLTPGPDTGDATLREFLDGVLAVMPWDDISAWLDDKMTNSADFIELYGVASSDDMYAMVEEVRALPEVQRIAAILEGFGVRLDEVLALVYEFFGWPAPGLKVKALPDDFDELLALVPWTDLAVLVFEHIDTDPEFNQVLTYLQSPEWDAIVQYVRDHPTYQVLKAFCLEKGVDLEAVAQAIHDFIHSLTPGPDTGDATLREFLDGVLAVMPWDDISAWLDDKMTNSADFIELYGVASSDDMYAMVEEVRALPEVQRIAAILEGFGVRLDEVLALVYEFFGWPAPGLKVKALPDDFDELLALVPWTDLAVLVFDHIDTDPEFNQVLTYLQSPEWDAIVQYVRDHPTYQVLKAFCLEKGVDLEAVAQAIHDFIHSLTPGPDTGDATLREFLDGVLAVMPWDDISAWLDDKMTNSADFIELYGVASSDDMYAMVEEVRALPEVQRIAAILEGFGVRLDEVLALVYEFFGWPAPGLKVKALPDDFDELLALVPWTDLAVLVFDHIDTDPEFNQVLTYLQSPEWDAIVQYVRDHPTYQVLKAFCLEKDVDLEAVAQAIHDFIHSLTPGPDTGDATLREFLDGVLAVMPWDDISAWLDDKMTNSADFIELYGVASSDDMYAMVEEVRALPEVQRIAAILEGFGVRLDEVLALVYEFFGWPAP